MINLQVQFHIEQPILDRAVDQSIYELLSVMVVNRGLRIVDCTLTTENNCVHSEDAGVECSGENINHYIYFNAKKMFHTIHL